MNTPATGRFPGAHFEVQSQDHVGEYWYHYVTSVTKARTWANELRGKGFGVEITGITPYGHHKMDTCEEGCKYCAKGVGKGGRESKEVRRAETKASYSNVSTVETEKLEVGDTLFGGTVRIVQDMGDGSSHPKKKYTNYPAGRVFSVTYVKGSKVGKLGEVHVKLGLKLAVTR